MEQRGVIPVCDSPQIYQLTNGCLHNEATLQLQQIQVQVSTHRILSKMTEYKQTLVSLFIFLYFILKLNPPFVVGGNLSIKMLTFTFMFIKNHSELDTTTSQKVHSD